MEKFKEYKPRMVKFENIVEVNNWKVKVYSITNKKQFSAGDILENAISETPKWLENAKILKVPNYSIATLIVHEGIDGVWTLINWWIGGEIMQNFTYHTSLEKPNEFKPLPCDGSMACVWEMSVICHERKAWIKHILKNADTPNFDEYLADVIEGLI